jgi:hypothetical protein
MISRELLLHEDSSLPRHLCFHPHVATVDYGHVWMLIKGYIYQLCGETLRMGVPASTRDFVGMSVTLTETKRKAAIN